MPSEDTQFKPGQSGNPGGVSKLGKEIRKLQKMNAAEFAEHAYTIAKMEPQEIIDYLSGPDVPAMAHMIGGVILECIETRRPHDLVAILPFIVGKPKETLEHHLPEQTIVHLRDGSQIIMGAKHGDDQSS